MNFRELRNRLISSLWDYIGCPVILSNQVQPEAEPPFCIYTVTAPYIPDGGMGDYEIADVAEGVKISRMEMPSATFSFTFCSQNRTAENGSAVNGEDEAWAVADKATMPKSAARLWWRSPPARKCRWTAPGWQSCSQERPLRKMV